MASSEERLKNYMKQFIAPARLNVAAASDTVPTVTHFCRVGPGDCFAFKFEGIGWLSLSDTRKTYPGFEKRLQSKYGWFLSLEADGNNSEEEDEPTSDEGEQSDGESMDRLLGDGEEEQQELSENQRMYGSVIVPGEEEDSDEKEMQQPSRKRKRQQQRQHQQKQPQKKRRRSGSNRRPEFAVFGRYRVKVMRPTIDPSAFERSSCLDHSSISVLPPLNAR